MPILYAALARRDLERIERYHRAIDPDLAVTIVERIVAATGVLRDVPLAGPATVEGHRRKWRVAGTQYIIFYRVAATEVRILRVIHGAQAAASP
ncbi:type II toxin-antitoxin system RelE/ParE family toxin [Sphingomonas donggukensis]|uniref:Type II toxin-antitoxin system RelE/ParE family toxin n=1 Tax=Sphingomonas donggukensis TaxID=2949093 RepID=A0ABY4TYF8_9SPHN|nr:type II toxin-antitoxin system RelE/ParE family toxin [Sphingomonas donggukensis]URW77034.1 type II toxin-antitoxin system RelE/ParE family toxin [Sphingomonas donggukensis]